MDDNEYYALMRKQNFHRVNIQTSKKESDFKKWTIKEGHEDAEMLDEKKNNIPEEEN